MTISSVQFGHRAGRAPANQGPDSGELGLEGEELYELLADETGEGFEVSSAEVEPRAHRAAPRFLRRRQIVLACASCGGRNYRKTKACREGAPPLQLKKYCSTCSAHTQHREAI